MAATHVPHAPAAESPAPYLPMHAGFLRVAAAAGFLVGLLPVALGLLSNFVALPEALVVMQNRAPLLLSLVWLGGIQVAQARAVGRWGVAAFCLYIAAALALTGLQFAGAALGVSLADLFDMRFGLLVKIAFVTLGWSSLLYAVLSMRARVLPVGVPALWAAAMVQSLFGLTLGQLMALASIAWGSVALMRIAAAPATIRTEPVGNRAPAGQRLLALDALRGLIMALMALDHIRLFLVPHPMESWESALPQYDSAGQFLSRFVTHICAPGFFLLMGAAMILFADSRRRAGWSGGRIAGYWALRGLLLVAVEQVLANPAMNGDFTPRFYGVLTGLGAAMMVGALALRLRAGPLLALGVGVTLCDQVLPAAAQQWGLPLTVLMRFLFLPGAAGDWFIVYSLFGWLGVAFLGMAFGRALLDYGDRAYRWALYAGTAGLALFPLVRLAGGFGNIRPIEGTGWIGFLTVVKYPPSLVLLLFAGGVLGVLLYVFYRAGPGLAGWGRPLVVIGQVPLFFYVVHLMFYRTLQVMWVSGNQLVGAGLPAIWFGWLAGLLLLYPLCVIYRQFKRDVPPGSVWRLF
jgi:uncharacterized membrane protein